MRSTTYLIDVDGTIFQKTGSIDDWYSSAPTLMPGVTQFFRKIEKESAHIVLVTARKESCRNRLEGQLNANKIPYDQLIMGVTNGKRVMINDGPSDLFASVPSFGISPEGIKDALCKFMPENTNVEVLADSHKVIVMHNDTCILNLESHYYDDLTSEEIIDLMKIHAKQIGVKACSV